MPLILAFYCIVGGTGPLPDFRRDLYTKVLNRMLTGRWRDDDDRQPDADACLQTLRAWAWAGAASNHPVSGVGTWADDIPTKRVRLGEADADALDHVATPLGPPDVDTGKTLRRFIHRSIREHLVAEHVASLPVDQAVEVLLPHLWYDPDWEYAAPAALAMHPQRDQLLRDLICRAASSDQIPGDLSVIDAGWEFRGLLARVAAESSEADWSPEVAGMIGQARVELARSGRFGDLGGAAPWGTSNRQAREALLGLLAGETDSWAAGRLAGGLAQLDPTAEDKRQAREALLGLLARADRQLGWPHGWRAGWPSSTRRRRTSARPARRCSGCWPARPTAGRPQGWRAGWPGSTRRRRTSARPARRCSGCWPARPTSGVAGWLAGGGGPARPDGGGQAPGPRGAARAAGPRDRQLGWPDGWRARWPGSTRRRRTSARPATRCSGCWPARPTAAWPNGWRAGWPGSTRRRRTSARPATRCSGCWPARPTAGVAGWLAGAVAQLDPTAEDKRQARDALLGLLARETDSGVAGWLAGGVAQLAPTAEDKRQARDALLGLLARETDSQVAGWLAGGGGPARPDGGGQAPGPRRAARAAGPRRPTAGMAGRLAGAVAQLDPTAEDKRQAREALLGLLARETDSGVAGWLADGVAQLDPTAEDKRQAREALLGLLARETDSGMAERLAGAVARLDPTAEDKRQARDALLGLLARETNSGMAAMAGGRGDPARPDGGGQAPGPRGAARAAGPRDRRWMAERLADALVPARPDSPRPQNMARLGGPTDRRTARCGAPELGTYQLACSPPLADLALRFTRLRHRTRQPQSRSRTPETAARGKVAGHASDKLQRKVAETTTCDHAMAVLAGTGRTRRIRNTASCHNRRQSPNRSSRTGAPAEQRSDQKRRTG